MEMEKKEEKGVLLHVVPRGGVCLCMSEVRKRREKRRGGLSLSLSLSLSLPPPAPTLSSLFLFGGVGWGVVWCALCACWRSST